METQLSDRIYAQNCVGGGKAITLLAATTDAVAHSVNGAAVADLGFFRQAAIKLVLTDAQAALGDKLDVYVDTSFDGGGTWVNAGHFTQIAGNGADAISEFIILDPGGAPGAVAIAATSDCASGVSRPALFGDALRARYTITNGGTGTQSFTFSVKAFVKF
jgi:hypothetical protein